MNAKTGDWLEIGAVEDIPRRGGRVVKTPRGCIAVFRAVDDRIFALDDRCPHKGGPLSDGMVHGTKVTCPLHAWVFSLETGETEGAETGRVRTHEVRVEAGRILLSAAALRD
ncbi:MAG: nitrite reductase small subunit NirD [Amaricoccus sp.]|mgnify:CR=1 FL=1